MAGRGRLYPINNGPRGILPGLPLGPGLMHPPPVQHNAGILGSLMGPLPGLPGSAMLMEQKMANQHVEIQRLLSENQRLAATHVALRQEFAASQQEIQRLQVITARESEKDQQIRALLEKSARMEADLCAAESLRTDLLKLHSEKQELSAQVHELTRESHRSFVNAEQVDVLRTELGSLHQELQQARMAYEQERKLSSDYLQQKHAIEKNMISMAREVEKLRAELSNVEKRTQGNGPVFGGGTGGPGVYNGMPQLTFENSYLRKQEAAVSVNGQSANPVDGKAIESGKYPIGMDINRDRLMKTFMDAQSASEWSTHIAPNGKAFYYHSASGVTQWDKPAALVAADSQELSQGQIEQAQLEALQSQMLQISSLQQQVSQNAMQQSEQLQAEHGNQHALAQMQSQQSLPGNVQNPGAQMHSVSQAQVSELTQAHIMQQSHMQSSLGQLASNAHGSYMVHPSYLSHNQQRLDPATYASRSEEPTIRLADREFGIQPHQLINMSNNGAPSSDASPLSATGLTTQHPYASVSPFINQKSRISEVALKSDSMSTRVNLIVTGFPDDYSNQNLEALFRPYGTVLYAKVHMENDTDQGKCLGLVSMDSRQAAEAAIDAIDGMSISGRIVKVEMQHGEHEAYLHRLHQQQLQQSLSGGGPTRWYHHNEYAAGRLY
eukprot:c25328_g1_i2 orf=216-2213(+)